MAQPLTFKQWRELHSRHPQMQTIASPGMTEDEMKKYIKRKLGDGVTDVELNDDDMNDTMRDAKQWFSIRVGNKTIRQVSLTASTSVYVLDPDVTEVVRMYLPSTHFPAVDTDDFSYTYSLLFGQWRSPGASPMPYSDLVQRLQYLKMSSHIFSADREFLFNPKTKELEIMPAPSILGTCLVEVWSGLVDTRDLQPEDENLLRRWALADAKITLGERRRKFAMYTTVAGERGLNGAALVMDGEKEKLQLEKDALNWKRAVPMISG